VSTPPIVLIHGYAGHATSWRAVRELLRSRAGDEVVAITAFGHEPTMPPSATIAFADEVARLAAIVRGLGRPARVCGYSMGGRLTLGLLATAPELVESAVIVGAHPGLTSEDDRRARREADAVWIGVLEKEGIEAFADKWQAQALFATQARLAPERLAEQRAIRVAHDPKALALAMESLGLAAMPSYWNALQDIVCPVELVVGGLDAKFDALARRMSERIPGARVVVVDDVGHNVPLENPEAVAALLVR